MAGSLFGLGAGTPSRFPYPDRPQPAPGVGPGASSVVRARVFIISGPGGGLFVYNGTPGLGTLIQSITAPSVSVDPYGNAIKGTNTTYQKISPTSWQAVAYQGNSIQFFTATSPAGPWAGTGNFISFSAAGPDGILINANNGTIQLAVTNTAVQVAGAPLDATDGLAVTGGATIDTATVTGVLTATGGTAATPTLVTTDVWRQVGAFVNGWAPPGAEHLDYTLNADNTVTVAGRVANAAGTAGNSQVCTLAAGYQTANRVEFAPANQTNAATAHTVQLDTAGNLQVNGAVAAGGIVSIQARFPLGAPA